MVTQDTLILGAYFCGFFSAAYMLPSPFWVLRMLCGWVSLILLGTIIFGFFFPEAAQLGTDIMNSGVKYVWNLTEE